MTIVVKYSIGRGADHVKHLKTKRDYDKWANGMDKRYGEDGWNLIFRETGTTPQLIRKGYLPKKGRK